MKHSTHPLATLPPRAVSQRGALRGDSGCLPTVGAALQTARPDTEKGTTARDPCKSQLDVTHQQAWRAAERRFGQGRGQADRQGLQEISHPCKLLSCHSLSARNPLCSPVRGSCSTPSSPALLPGPPHSTGAGVLCRGGSPALLSPAFPSGARVPASSGKPAGCPRIAGYHSSGAAVIPL